MGKCYCGAVRYRVADEFLYAANCHCSNCRAATGSAFQPFGGIERDKLEVTEGQMSVKTLRRISIATPEFRQFPDFPDGWEGGGGRSRTPRCVRVVSPELLE